MRFLLYVMQSSFRKMDGGGGGGGGGGKIILTVFILIYITQANKIISFLFALIIENSWNRISWVRLDHV